ncbi:hypothetical protein FKW77_009606 [Venturia effusa]|uniref:Uncharacterized protein n=1 Tax=Venturia effusa TaxID=50376 RepID=A0A517L232_9PEZI|nr:hypothetical protein FKW77_009606 [Venturia effusa]
MAHFIVTLPTKPVPIVGSLWPVRKITGADWNAFLWHCKNVYDWAQTTKEGTHMTAAQLDEKCRVTNLEWFFNWPWERITGRVQFPDPVELDESVPMSDGVRDLRDTYLEMQALFPTIKQPQFRWEQIDYWDVLVQYREHPEVQVGGSKDKFNPGVSGWSAAFSDDPKELLWFLPLALSVWIPAYYVMAKVFGREADSQEIYLRNYVWYTLGLVLLWLWYDSCKYVHKGRLIKTKSTKSMGLA